MLTSWGGDAAVAAAGLAPGLSADSLAVEEHDLTVARHRAIAPRAIAGRIGPRAELARRRARGRSARAIRAQSRGSDCSPQVLRASSPMGSIAAQYAGRPACCVCR